MPFLADDGLMLALYQARQAQERRGEEGEEYMKKKNVILDNRSISNSNSRADVVAIILGIFFVGAVASFALYIGYKNEASKGLEYTFISKDMMISNEDIEFKDDYEFLTVKGNLLIPKNYILYLNSSFVNRTYHGLVKINFICKEDTDQITLNSKNHNMDKVALSTITTIDIDEFKVTKLLRNTIEDTVTLKLNKKLISGSEYRIFIGFNGTITNKSKNGIYIIEKPTPSILGVFQHKLARSAFPCFDDLKYPATFELILQHDEQFTCVSNMPVKNKVKLEETKRMETYFAISPNITTDTFVFILTKQDFVKVPVAENVEGNMYFPFGRESEVHAARAATPKIYKYYQDLFGKNNQFSQIDFVPVAHLPTRINGGHGLALIREEDFLYDEESGTLRQLERVMRSIAHGFLNQRFITITETDSCYYSVESLKLLLEYMPIIDLYPDWDIETTFDLDVIYGTLRDDSYNTSVFVSNLDRGASVYAMLLNFIGKTDFLAGVKNGLASIKENPNADFCGALEAAMTAVLKKFDFIEYFKIWRQEPGFPLVTVGKEQLQLKLSQSIYLPDDNVGVDTAMRSVWRIPIYFYCNGTTEKQELKVSLDMFEYPSECSGSTWYTINHGSHWYYRTNYVEGNWDAMLEQMNKNHTKFTSAERAKLLSDIFAFAYSGLQNVSRALEFTKYLSKENDYVPYQIAFHQLNFIKHLFPSSTIETCMQQYIYHQLTPWFEKLHAQPILNHRQQRLFSLLLENRLNSNEAKDHILRTELENLFLKWIVSNQRMKMNGTVKYQASKVAMAVGNQYEFDDLLLIYEKSGSMVDRDLILKALSYSTDQRLLQRYLSYASEGSSTIDNYDKIKVLTYACLNPKIREVAWSQAKQYMAWFYDLYENNLTVFFKLFKNCLGTMHTDQDLLKVKAFAGTIKTNHFLSELTERMIKTINLNIKFVKNANDIKEWLKENESDCL